MLFNHNGIIRIVICQLSEQPYFIKVCQITALRYYHNYFCIYNTMLSKLKNVYTTRYSLNHCNRQGFNIPKMKRNSQLKIDPQVAYNHKRSTYINIGLSCFMFAICFAGIPIYRTFCEHMGLVGDTAKKTYDFKGKKMANLKKFKIVFQGIAEPGVDWQFEPVEKEVLIGASETAIVFYKLYNRSQKPVVGFSTYNIAPQDANVYFSKIQCFCFNQQMINPKQELLLPLFFYLQPQIVDDMDVGRIPEIKLTYHFLKSAKQDLAKFAEEELKRVQDNKKKLREMRASKMKMTKQQYQQHIEKEHQFNKQVIEQAERKQKQLEQKQILESKQQPLKQTAALAQAGKQVVL